MKGCETDYKPESGEQSVKGGLKDYKPGSGER